MSEKAPMPPWWVEEKPLWNKPKTAIVSTLYEVWGGSQSKPERICSFSDWVWSNAKELAHLIVQRTKQ